MVLRMSSRKERKRPHRDLISAHNSASTPRLGWHVFEQRNGGETHSTELLDMFAPWNAVGLCCGRSFVFRQSLKRCGEATPEPKCSISEGALRVCDMTQSFAHAPLPGGISILRFLFRDTAEQGLGLLKLALECRDRVIALHTINVLPIEIDGFVPFRSSSHGHTVSQIIRATARSIASTRCSPKDFQGSHSDSGSWRSLWVSRPGTRTANSSPHAQPVNCLHG